MIQANIPRSVLLRDEHTAALKVTHPGNIVPLISVEVPDMVEHKPGMVVVTRIPVAAKMLVKRTHRVASDAEYEAYKEDLAQRTDDLRRQELEKKGVTTTVAAVDVGPRRKAQQQALAEKPQGDK